jgi:hypothetical protein
MEWPIMGGDFAAGETGKSMKAVDLTLSPKALLAINPDFTH